MIFLLFLILVVLSVIYLRLKFLEEKELLPDNLPAGNEKIMFIYKGEQIIMTKAQKDEWDLLLPHEKKSLMKEIKKYKRPLNNAEAAAASSINKMSNKPEDRQVWLK